MAFYHDLPLFTSTNYSIGCPVSEVEKGEIDFGI